MMSKANFQETRRRSSLPEELRRLKETKPHELEEMEKFAWHRKTVLGEGSFGKVYKGWNTATQEEVAVKVVSKHHYLGNDQMRQAIRRETDIQLQISDCENVLRLFARHRVKNGYALVMELCEKDLQTYIKECKGLTELQTIDFLQQLANGLSVLFNRGIAHRDLKPGNILLKRPPGSSRMTVKLADFGFARKYLSDEKKKKIVMTSVAGTAVYMAPEALDRVFFRGKGYDERVDLWSTGAVLYFCLVGSHAFYATLQEILPILRRKGNAIAFVRKATSSHVEYLSELPTEVNARLSGQFKTTIEVLLQKLLVVDAKQRMDYPQFFQFVGDLSQQSVITNSTASMHTRRSVWTPAVIEDSMGLPDVTTSSQAKVENIRIIPTETHQPEKIYTVVFAGTSNVGKTCLVQRLSTLRFPTSVGVTVGVDQSIVNFSLEGRRVLVQIWDTGGQERHSELGLTHQYLRKADGAVIVYDITWRKSFEDIPKWHSRIMNSVGSDVSLALLLLGNKVDDADKRDRSAERAVSTREGEALAKKIGAQFCEVSAKTNENVSSAFTDFVRKLHLLQSESTAGNAVFSNLAREIDQQPTIRLSLSTKPKQKEKSYCCWK